MMNDHSAQCTLESGIQPLMMPIAQSRRASSIAKSRSTSLSSSFADIKSLCSERPLAGGLIYISLLECSGWQFRMAKPISVQESYDEGVWIRRLDSLGILAYGRSRDEVTKAFCEEFACCWEEIAREDDANLTADAQELKSTILSIVRDAKPLE